MNFVNFDNVGFIYKFWYCVFNLIENILPFRLMKKCIFKNTKEFSDKWVLLNLILSFITMISMHNGWFQQITKIIMFYSFVRILEIMIYQINVLLFHPYKALEVEKKKHYRVQNPYRSVVLLIHNLFEVVFWFTSMTSCLYPTTDPLIIKMMDHTIRIFTFTYENVSTEGHLLQQIFFVEVLCGLILTIISVAKFIGELPHSNLTKDKQKE